MRILLTNDDGFSSPGITLLASALRETGRRVYVVAPDKNRSGSSHSITFLNKPVKLTVIEKDTWSCSGMPVDCIITSLLGGIPDLCVVDDDGNLILDKAPDLVLSGINKGANLGTDIIYSGTAAAARQAAIFGIRSVSLSLAEIPQYKEWHWQSVISYVTDNIDLIAGLWKEGAFVNINFPNNGKTPASLVKTFPAKRYYKDRIVNYLSPCGSTYCFAVAGEAEIANDSVSRLPEEGSDWEAVLKGNAAYSLVLTQPSCSD